MRFWASWYVSINLTWPVPPKDFEIKTWKYLKFQVESCPKPLRLCINWWFGYSCIAALCAHCKVWFKGLCFLLQTTLEAEYSIFALSYDHYLPIHSLVEYHQMETRVALRLIILQIFGVMCSLSKAIVSTLLVTVLPLELSMDIMSHAEGIGCHNLNIHDSITMNFFVDTQRTCYSALVMSMLFSTAEPLPVGHYGKTFEKSCRGLSFGCISWSQSIFGIIRVNSV